MKTQENQITLKTLDMNESLQKQFHKLEIIHIFIYLCIKTPMHRHRGLTVPWLVLELVLELELELEVELELVLELGLLWWSQKPVAAAAH